MPMLMIARPLARRYCASDPPHVVFWSGLERPLARRYCASSGSVVLPSIPKPMPMLMIARPLARRYCASSGFPYCQKTALELQALTREPPLVVPTKRRACAWLARGLRLPVGLCGLCGLCKPTATKNPECARMSSQDALGRVFRQK